MLANDNWATMLKVLEKNGKFGLLANITKDEIESLVQFLDVFHHATKSMESTSKPTIFAVVAWLDKLERFIKQSPDDSLIVLTAKQNMEVYFLLTVMENKEYLRSKYHLMSNFFHPALKTMVKFSPLEKEEIRREVIFIYSIGYDL